MEHHLSDSIPSVENLNFKRYDCITRLESLKGKFHLNAINIKRNLVLKIENLMDESQAFEKILKLRLIKIY